MGENKVIVSIHSKEHSYQPQPTVFEKPTQTLSPKSRRKKRPGTTLVGIDVAKEDDMSSWYQQVLLKGDMIDYYDISGCYIVKPYAWDIWDRLRVWFDGKIKQLGVRNCSFPLLVSEAMLNSEKEHIEGFAAEVAWITRTGKSELESRIAIRPTSETIMYPYFAKWIRSHRDLPLRLNQWNSVVRWEFKHPLPFLRSREFHWQEGHTAHLTRQSADQEVLHILDLYAAIYEEFLAVPVIKGRKTDKEKFAGALYTTTVEGFIPTTGRGIQGATSHGLGQNFSKMFGISVEDPSKIGFKGADSPHVLAWQNSWAFSTRVLGVMVMIHGDNKGLVIPPRVAPIQVVMVPVGLTVNTPEETKKKILGDISKIVDRLTEAEVRVELDDRDEFSPGYKFNHWELRGVPLRLEFGPEERQNGFITTSRRDAPGRGRVAVDRVEAEVTTLLRDIQAHLYEKALYQFRSHVKIVSSWSHFCQALDDKNLCLIPHCLTEDCEDSIKQNSKGKVDNDAPEDARAPSMGAKSLCVPFDQPSRLREDSTRCFNPECEKGAKQWCLFGRSY